ncbi:hypothetical protein EJB05_09498, partial [Eragrostis curvula]
MVIRDIPSRNRAKELKQSTGAPASPATAATADEAMASPTTARLRRRNAVSTATPAITALTVVGFVGSWDIRTATAMSWLAPARNPTKPRNKPSLPELTPAMTASNRKAKPAVVIFLRRGEVHLLSSVQERLAVRYQPASLLHLNNEMVFLPIHKVNHWYLVVLDAPRCKVHVLDSMGPKKSRADDLAPLYITNQLQKLEDYYEKIRKPRGCKWRDHYVSDWQIVEQIEKSMQKDGSSCGLFILKFMEYWTGTRLSQIFTQEDMNHFRSKLAVLLVNSKLNNLRPGAATNTIPEDQPEDDGEGDDSDECEITE